ncbi:MAG: 50S ribosomal protein L28, partial [Clostridia bacterium]|nr:50S ribosomal protein L28 [Clostridia bacterium]
MAKCSVCGKGVSFGHNDSHSHRKTNRMWKPNIRRVRVVADGTHKTVYVCSRCL